MYYIYCICKLYRMNYERDLFIMINKILKTASRKSYYFSLQITTSDFSLP